MNGETAFDAITRLDNQRQQAMLAGNIDTVETIVSTRLRYVHASGTDEDHTLYIDRLRNGYYQYQAMETKRRDFTNLGDTILVHGDMRIHVIVDSNHRDFVGRYLQVWAMESGSWKMVAWQTTKLPD